MLNHMLILVRIKCPFKTPQDSVCYWWVLVLVLVQVKMCISAGEHGAV